MNTPGQLLLLFIGIFGVGTPAFAQDSPPPSPDSSAQRRMCFHSRPAPHCDRFWLTEFGIAARLTDNYDLGNSPLYTWELGAMANEGPRTAVGVALFAEAGSGVGAIGIRPRFRLWLGGPRSLDVAPGLVLRGNDGIKSGFSGHVALNLNDFSAATLHLISLPGTPYGVDPGAHVALFAGARLGSAPGTLFGIGFPLVVTALVLIECAHGACFGD